MYLNTNILKIRIYIYIILVTVKNSTSCMNVKFIYLILFYYSIVRDAQFE